MTSTPDPRCMCGHRLSEHPERYGLTLCTGRVHAIDATVEDAGAGVRLASCGCPGFLAASERLLRTWGVAA